MNAFRTFQRVTNSRRIVLKDVPFASGQDLEVLLLPREDRTDIDPLADMKVLLRETQALPHLRNISEKDIRDEVLAARRGK